MSSEKMSSEKMKGSKIRLSPKKDGIQVEKKRRGKKYGDAVSSEYNREEAKWKAALKEEKIRETEKMKLQQKEELEAVFLNLQISKILLEIEKLTEERERIAVERSNICLRSDILALRLQLSGLQDSFQPGQSLLRSNDPATFSETDSSSRVPPYFRTNLPIVKHPGITPASKSWRNTRAVFLCNPPPNMKGNFNITAPVSAVKGKKRVMLMPNMAVPQIVMRSSFCPIERPPPPPYVCQPPFLPLAQQQVFTNCGPKTQNFPVSPGQSQLNSENPAAFRETVPLIRMPPCFQTSLHSTKQLGEAPAYKCQDVKDVLNLSFSEKGPASKSRKRKRVVTLSSSESEETSRPGSISPGGTSEETLTMPIIGDIISLAHNDGEENTHILGNVGACVGDEFDCTNDDKTMQAVNIVKLEPVTENNSYD